MNSSKPTRLLVISHTAHYQRAGRIYGWGPTVREIDALAQACGSLVHLASLHPGPPPPSAQAYSCERVAFIPVPPAGGANLKGRMSALLAVPAYLRALRREISQADFVQVRAPHALALTAMLALAFFPAVPRWYKYAGDWSGKSGNTIAFRLQRGWLRSSLGRGPVAVNGRWAGQPPHVFSVDNPSFSLQQVAAAGLKAASKRLDRPLRLVFAGRLEAAKGAGIALDTARLLSRQEPVRLDIFGDGPQRAALVNQAEASGLAEQVQFHGWVHSAQLWDYLSQAHFALLPSRSESWPKFLSEAMAFGAVAVASPVGAIPQVLAETGAGICTRLEAEAFMHAIAELSDDPARWQQFSRAGVAAAPRFTYERYILALDEMWAAYRGASPFNPDYIAKVRQALASFPVGWQAGTHG